MQYAVQCDDCLVTFNVMTPINLPPCDICGGTLFVQSGGSRNASDPPVVAQVVVAAEQYNRLARTLQKKLAVTLQMDIDNQFLDADPNGHVRAWREAADRCFSPSNAESVLQLPMRREPLAQAVPPFSVASQSAGTRTN